MMMHAYDIDYLEDARDHLGEMLHYGVQDLGYGMDEFWELFCTSDIAKYFESGIPKYNAGMSGVELARNLLYEKLGITVETRSDRGISTGREYWTGWILARYQWEKNLSFRRLKELGIDAVTVSDMYIYHEADERKFIDRADEIIRNSLSSEENRLRRLRTYAHLTQKMLSEKSGVSLRMIQLYEQGQNDLSKAQVSVVISLAKALNCDIDQLVD